MYLLNGPVDSECNISVHTELSSRLPAPPPEIGPASVMVGNLVSGKRIAQASGRDLGQIEDNDQARKVCVRGGLLVFCIIAIIINITHTKYT